MLTMTAGLFAWAYRPKFAVAAQRDPRLIVIILRGALDGLTAVPPVGDPDYVGLHGPIALSLAGDPPALPLDSFFALHPSLPGFARLYAAGQAAVVHAVATGYRERSHFDGQDVLESGMPGPGHVQTGWLNRALEALPPGELVARKAGLGVGPSTPLILRGPAPVTGWAPQNLPAADADLAERVLALYQGSDEVLAKSLAEGLDLDRIASREMSGTAKPMGGADSAVGMRQAALGAAKLMAAEDGPRIAALAFNGWDTHANEGGATGMLAQLLGGLDGAFDAFEAGLGPAWGDTAILAVTEFGRTAKVNGTTGTDHGTGTVALLAGGAIKGGRVIADWPGLSPARLYQNRDLYPTTDLRAVLKGLLSEHLGLSENVLSQRVFPETGALKSIPGLIS